jgi:hypothetical protein
MHFKGQTDHVPTKLDEPSESCCLLSPIKSFAFCMAAGCSLTHPYSPDHITDMHFVGQTDHVPINLDEPTESCCLLSPM